MKIPQDMLKSLRAMVAPVDGEAELRAICRGVKTLDGLSPALKRGMALAIAARAVMIYKKAGAVK
jgi:hypothetical protein